MAVFRSKMIGVHNGPPASVSSFLIFETVSCPNTTEESRWVLVIKEACGNIGLGEPRLVIIVCFVMSGKRKYWV